nr:ABC transporter substrate-binding protein [Klebsiella variicola]
MGNNRVLFVSFLSIMLIFPVAGYAKSTLQDQTGTRAENVAKAPALKFNRIVITGNCPFGVIMANNLAYKHVVGVGPWAFLHSNMKILKDMKPDIARITTNFINKDYVVNMESLL